MFIGHFAVAFGSKRFAPRTNMAALTAAPLFADMLWPVFLLLGWEKVRIDPGNTRFTPLDLYWFPWSHSLVMLVAWATLFGGLYYAVTRYRPGAIVIWIGVVSHWLLDWITHRPDMPLYPEGTRYGLGLWNSIPGTMIVELTMFAIGIWMYLRTTRSKDSIGRYALLAYVVLLLLSYIGDRFGPPPSSTGDIAWSGLIAEAILLPWAWWFDHHRSVTIKDREITSTV